MHVAHPFRLGTCVHFCARKLSTLGRKLGKELLRVREGRGSREVGRSTNFCRAVGEGLALSPASPPPPPPGTLSASWPPILAAETNPGVQLSSPASIADGLADPGGPGGVAGLRLPQGTRSARRGRSEGLGAGGRERRARSSLVLRS